MIDARHNVSTGALIDVLRGPNNKPIDVTDLWPLPLGNGGSAGSPNSLYFTAGLVDEGDGLFWKFDCGPRTVDLGDDARRICGTWLCRLSQGEEREDHRPRLTLSQLEVLRDRREAVFLFELPSERAASAAAEPQCPLYVDFGLPFRANTARGPDIGLRSAAWIIK